MSYKSQAAQNQQAKVLEKINEVDERGGPSGMSDEIDRGMSRLV